MAKMLITCDSVNNVKPTITARPILDTEQAGDLVNDNSVAIIVGTDVNTRAKFFTTVTDLANRYIGELGFIQIPLVVNLDAGPVAVTAPAPLVLNAQTSSTIESVQWFKNLAPVVGATTTTLTIDPSTAGADDGQYFCRGFYNNGNSFVDSLPSIVTVS